MESGPALMHAEHEQALEQRNLAEVYGDRVITLFGITGTIKELGDACTASEDKRNQEADNIFVVSAMNEAGEEIEPEDLTFFERTLQKHGEEIKITVRQPEAATSHNPDSAKSQIDEREKTTELKKHTTASEKTKIPIEDGQSIVDEQEFRAAVDLGRTSNRETLEDKRAVAAIESGATIAGVEDAGVRVSRTAYEPKREPLLPLEHSVQAIFEPGSNRVEIQQATETPESSALPREDREQEQEEMRAPEAALATIKLAGGDNFSLPVYAEARVVDDSEASDPGAAEFGYRDEGIFVEGPVYDQISVDQTIREVLNFNPHDDAPELFDLTDYDTVTVGDEIELGEPSRIDQVTVFTKLNQYIDDLEITEPIKAERVESVVEEIEQVSEELADLLALQSIAEIMDKANGYKSIESIEREIKIELKIAKLEAICTRLLEEFELEPRTEVIQSLIRECIEAAQINVNAKRLSPMELAHKYMHEVKLPVSFTQVQRDAIELVRLAAQMLTKKLFPVTT